MTKVSNPFHSLSAKGTVGGLTIRRRKRIAIAEKKPIPDDAKTPEQLAWRTFFQECLALWKVLTPDEKQAWETAARPYRITGYNYFMKTELDKGIVPPAVLEKFQEYVETPVWNPNFHSFIWRAETFLTVDGYRIERVKLLLRRCGEPGLITVGIKDTAGEKPTGPDLTVGTTPGNSLPLSPDFELREITLTPYNLLPAHLYATVPRAPDGSSTNYATWAGRSSAPLYADGKYCMSTNSGASWSDPIDDGDLMFETWGYAL